MAATLSQEWPRRAAAAWPQSLGAQRGADEPIEHAGPAKPRCHAGAITPCDGSELQHRRSA